MLRLLLIMAITFIGTGGSVDGASSAIAPIPSGLAGDQLVICVTGLESTGSPSTPTASGFTSPFENHLWFDAADHTADTLVAAVLRRTADGTEGSSVTVSTFGWSKCKVEILRFRGTTSWRDLEAGAAFGLVSSQQYNATLTGSGNFDPPDMRTDDLYVGITCLESTGYVTGSHALVVSGMTFGSSAVRDVDSPSVPGTRFHTVLSIHEGTSGSSGSDPTVRFNTNIPLSANGVTVLFRLREEAVDATPSVPDTITVGVTELPSIAVALTVQESINVGLSDSVSVQQQTASKSVSDDIAVALTDSVSVFVLADFKQADDTITVALTDAVSVFQNTAEKSVSDDIVVALTDQVTVLATFEQRSVSDTPTVAVSEVVFVTASLPAIADTILVAINDNASVFALNQNITVGDAPTVALTDLVSTFILADFVTVPDGINVALDELVTVSATLSVTDDINVALADAVAVLATEQTISTPDTISVGLTDTVDVDVTLNPVSTTDTITVGITDTVSITTAINRLDIMFVALGETISLAVTAAVSDTATIGLTDAVAVEVTFIPGNPQIRRFSLTHSLRPIEVGRSGVSIA